MHSRHINAIAALLVVPTTAVAHSESMLFVPLLQIGMAGGATVGAAAGIFKTRIQLKLIPSLLAALVILGAAGALWAEDIRIFPYAVAYATLAAAPPFALCFAVCKELSARIAGAILEQRASKLSEPPSSS